MANEAWITRQTGSPEARRRYEEERLILWTTEAIWKAMDDGGLTRAELAERLGTSRANVTQLLSGTRNMTLRSLAGLAHACGLRAGVHLEELVDSVFTEVDDPTDGRSVRFPMRRAAWLSIGGDEAADDPQLFPADMNPIASEPEVDHPTRTLQLVAA